MSEVKRYMLSCYMDEHEDGLYIDRDDYEALRAKLAASEAANAQMRKALTDCVRGRLDRVVASFAAALATDAGKGWVSTEGAITDSVYEATNSEVIGDTVHTFATLHVRLPADWAGREVYILLKPEDKP